MNLITLQLLYLNSTVSEEVEIAEESPAIKAWDTQKLKRREKQEIAMGGFGMLPIKEGLQYIEQRYKTKMTRKKVQELKEHPELGDRQPGNISYITILIDLQ